MTCIIDGCQNPVRGKNCRTCHAHIHDVAKHGSGTARAWTSPDEVDRDPAKIAENKRIGEARRKLARLQGRAT